MCTYITLFAAVLIVINQVLMSHSVWACAVRSHSCHLFLHLVIIPFVEFSPLVPTSPQPHKHSVLINHFPPTTLLSLSSSLHCDIKEHGMGALQSSLWNDTSRFQYGWERWLCRTQLDSYCHEALHHFRSHLVYPPGQVLSVWNLSFLQLCTQSVFPFWGAHVEPGKLPKPS